MTGVDWKIPPSVLRLLERSPNDRAVVVLLRHSVRDHLPSSEVGYTLPITNVGRQLALELGGVLHGRLRTLHTSPLARCVQTAQALAEGADSDVKIVFNRLLGDPGVFVLDGRLAWPNWEQLGHAGVMHHLVTETEALPGMARAAEAARYLLQSMLATAGSEPGVHVFVTHDSVVTAMAARLLGRPIKADCWPWFLEGVFFWTGQDGIHVAYRNNETVHPVPLNVLSETEVIEFARREIAATVGFETGARFFMAGGSFKSLLTGRPPRDIDLWAPSKHDRELLIAALQSRGATLAGRRPFSEAFDIAGRIVEVPLATEPNTLAARLSTFDIGLSAIGVEHLPDGGWSALVHPLALKSVQRREVLLLKPLVNWKYALTTLERMRRYARELGFSVPPEEEAEVWRVFNAQDSQLRTGLIDRYRLTSLDGCQILKEI